MSIVEEKALNFCNEMIELLTLLYQTNQTRLTAEDWGRIGVEIGRLGELFKEIDTKILYRENRQTI